MFASLRLGTPTPPGGGAGWGGRDAYALFRTPAPPPSGHRRRGGAGGAAAAAGVPADADVDVDGTGSRGTGASTMAGVAVAPPLPMPGAGAADAMIAELYAYAADPAGYRPSLSSTPAGAGTAGTGTTGIAGTAGAPTTPTPTTTGGGGSTTTTTAGGAYETYAARSPSQRRSRLVRRWRTGHAVLMSRLAGLAALGGDDCGTGSARGSGTGLGGGGIGGGSRGGIGGGGKGGVGTAAFDDGRFLVWVGSTLLGPGGAVVRRTFLAEGQLEGEESESEAVASARLSRSLVGALDGLAASVRDCLCRGVASSAQEEDANTRAMLRVLLERNGGALLRHGGGGGDAGDAGNGDGDDRKSLRSYLKLASQVRAALAGSSAAAAGDGFGDDGGDDESARNNKRRRLLRHHHRHPVLHGGGYAASSSATGTTRFAAARWAQGSTAATATATTTTAATATTTTAVLAYALAAYLASDACPFFASSSSQSNGPTASTPAMMPLPLPLPTWDLLRACTVHAASEMGLVCHLPSVRAGLVCYGLDRLADGVGGGGGGEYEEEHEHEHEHEEEHEHEHEEGGGSGSMGRRTEGLSPVSLVELILSDSGIIPTLQKITRHPHPRELIAHIAATLLGDYIFAASPAIGSQEEEDGYGADGEEEEEEANADENENAVDTCCTTSGPTAADAAAVVNLFRHGANGETVEGYLRTLEALQAQTKRSKSVMGQQSIGATSRLSASAAVRAGSKRRALEIADGYAGNGDMVGGASSVVVLESLGTAADIPSAPTIRPAIIELEAHLANSDIESAIRLCQSLESSSASSMDDKQVGWHHVLEYMDHKDMIFDPPSVEMDSDEDGPLEELPKGDTTRTFQLLQVGSAGLTSIKWYFERYAEQAITDAIEAGQELASAVSSDEIATAREAAEMTAARSEYVQFQVRRTMLRFFLTRNFSPSTALKEAQRIATPISPDGRGGFVASYVGIDTGAPQSDAQALRKIHAILSTRHGEESSSIYLPRIQGADAAANLTLAAPAPAPAPALLEGPAAAALLEGPAAAADEAQISGVEGGQDQQQNEEVIALDDSSDEEHDPTEAAAVAAEDSESDDVVVLDDDSEGTRSYEEPTHEDGPEMDYDEDYYEEEPEEEPIEEDYDGIEQEGEVEPIEEDSEDIEQEGEDDDDTDFEAEVDAEAIDAEAEAEANEDYADEEVGGEEGQGDADEASSARSRTASSDTTADESDAIVIGSFSEGEQEDPHENEGAGEDEQPPGQAEAAPESAESAEAVEPGTGLVDQPRNKRGEETAMSDDMDEADEATAEERSARDEILSEEEEIAAQEEEARQQHLADLAREEINSQKREALARRREAPIDNDDTTAAHVAEGDNLSEYFTETSQGTQSGAEFEVEPEPSQLPPAASIPRDDAGDAQPDSILIAAAMDSQRQQQQMEERLGKPTASTASVGNYSGKTGEEFFDDTTAAVAGTDLEQDEFLTDHGGASQPGSQATSEAGAEAEAEVEGEAESHPAVDEAVPQPDILETMALRAGEVGPPPGEGIEGRKAQSIDTESIAKMSMIVNPPDSPKGSVVLDPSEVGDGNAQTDTNALAPSIGGEVQSTLASASAGQAGVEEEESEGLNDEDLINIEEVGDLSYSELQFHCKLRGLSAGGKTEVLRKRLVEFLRKEEKPIDEATAAEKTRIIEQERRFQEEAELQRQEQERLASKAEAKRLRRVQDALMAREAEREQDAQERLDSNREFLAKVRARREVEEKKQRELEAERQREEEERLQREINEQIEAALKEAVAEEGVMEAAQANLKEAVAEVDAEEERQEQQGEAMERAEAVKVKQEESAENPPSAADMTSDGGGFLSSFGGTIMSGVKSLGDMISPKPRKRKDPETIDLMDDSDEEDAVQETAIKVVASEIPSTKAASQMEEDAELTADRIDDLSYRAAQKECKKRNLLAVGSGDILKGRLRQALQQSANMSLLSRSPGATDDGKALSGEAITAQPAPPVPDAASSIAPGLVASAKPAPADHSPSHTAAPDSAAAPAPVAAKTTSSESGGMFSVLKSGAMQVMGAFSPSKEPETIDLLDADDSSDDEVEVTKVVKPSAVVKKEEDQDEPTERDDVARKIADSKVDDASMLMAKDIDNMSYHELRSECKRRNLGGNGKKGELQEKLKSAIHGQEGIPASIGDTTVPPSPMSSIASTPDHSSLRSRSRTTPRSGLSTGGSRSRRGKAEARAKFNSALGLPAVKEEEEEGEAGGVSEESAAATAAASAAAATPDQRPGRRRKKADDDEDQSKADESKPSPPKRQKRTKTAATPSSVARPNSARSTRSTRSSARSTRSGRRI